MITMMPLLASLALVAPVEETQDRAAPTPRRPAQLIIAPDIVEDLDQLADSLRVKTVRCLIGIVEHERAAIDLAWKPPTSASEDGHAEYQPCPLATIARWLNHPHVGEGRPEESCYMSHAEIQEALRPRAPAVQFVQVNARVACWWTQSQIARAADQAIRWPLRGQIRPRYAAFTAPEAPLDPHEDSNDLGTEVADALGARPGTTPGANTTSQPNS